MRVRGKTWAVLVFAALMGCAKGPAPQPDLAADLQDLLDRAVADEASVPGAAVHVDFPGFAWEGAVGFADPEAGIPMTAEHPVRVASNTKTYVAAAILRLAEQGLIGLDDPIASHLPESFVAALEGDGFDPGAITIRHLLTHTSGLDDHGDESYAEQILADPHHRWTRAEQLACLIDRHDPLGPPGRIYHYSDTGYVLLGEILERKTGMGFAQSVWSQIDRAALGLDTTWFETLESRPDGAPERARQFYQGLDTTDFDPSFDLWGGGGIVATVGDLARFMRALHSGRVFDNPATFETMLTTYEGLQAAPDATDHSLQPGAYRMGLWAVEVAGVSGFRHTGFWGTSATYYPDLDLVVTGTQNAHGGNFVLPTLEEQMVERIAASTRR